MLLATCAMLASSSIASAGWSNSSISLKSGENAVVEITNPDNVVISLTIENISAPSALLPYIVITPTKIDNYARENVTITFVQIPQSVRATISPDIYSIKVAELVVYLDVTDNPLSQENIDNIMAELENMRLDSQNIWREVFATKDNLQLLMQLQDNFVQLTTRFEVLCAKVYENSENWENALLDLKTNALAQLKTDYDGKIDQARTDGNTRALEYSVATGIVVFFITIFIVPKFSRKKESVSPKKSTTLLEKIENKTKEIVHDKPKELTPGPLESVA